MIPSVGASNSSTPCIVGYGRTQRRLLWCYSYTATGADAVYDGRRPFKTRLIGTGWMLAALSRIALPNFHTQHYTAFCPQQHSGQVDGMLSRKWKDRHRLYIIHFHLRHLADAFIQGKVQRVHLLTESNISLWYIKIKIRAGFKHP